MASVIYGEHNVQLVHKIHKRDIFVSTRKSYSQHKIMVVVVHKFDEIRLGAFSFVSYIILLFVKIVNK